MIIKLGGCDADVVQPFRAVARQCAKRTTFIIMLACLGFAVSAQIGADRRGGESTNASAMEETTAAAGKGATAELTLSDEQRGRIYEAVMRIQNASVADEPAPAVADALPSAVPLQDLPAGIVREIPPRAGPQIREVRRSDRGRRPEEPRGGGHDASLQAVAVTWLAPQPRVQQIIARCARPRSSTLSCWHGFRRRWRDRGRGARIGHLQR